MSVIVTSLVNYTITLASPVYTLKPFETKIFDGINLISSDLATKDSQKILQAELIISEDADGLTYPVQATKKGVTTIDGTKFGAMIPGFIGPDKPSLVFVRDHPYKQIVGDATREGQHQVFKDYGVFPYCITVNTSLQSADAVNNQAFGDGMMTWEQVKAIQDEGVEITNHANRHIYNLSRVNTGFSMNYNGANGTAFGYVTASPKTLHIVDSVDRTFDLTDSNYDTIAKLVAAVSAIPGWYATYADELDGTERSADLILVSSPGKPAKNLTGNTKFALSGGFYVRYTGTAYKTAFVKLFGTPATYIQLFGDGILVAEYAFNNASYDTIAELCTTISAVDGGSWECKPHDDNYATNGLLSYCDGSEPLTGQFPTATELQDCYQRYVWFSCGMPIQQVHRKLLKKAKDVAATYGVKMRNFSDVGGGAWSQIMAQIGEFSNLSRATNVLTTIRPGMIPAKVAAALPIFSYDEGLANAAQVAAIIPALLDSPGFVLSLFVHQYNNDVPMGRNIMGWSAGSGASYQSGAKMSALFSAIKSATDDNELNMLTQQGFYAARSSISKPVNLLANPKWKNSGETLTGFPTGDGGLRVPQWLFKFSTVSSIDITDGVATITTSSNTPNNQMQAMLWLEAGKSYHVGLITEVLDWVGGPGLYVTLAPMLGYEYLHDLAGSPGLKLDDYAGSAAKGHKFHNGLLTIPLPERKRPYIRSKLTGPFNLSTAKNIKIQIYDGTGTSIAQVGDIDCSTGAVLNTAVTALEVATAINNAIKANATFAVKPEYHNLAKVENGRLILESPYPNGMSASSGKIVIIAPTSGGAAEGTQTIFGAPIVGSQRPEGVSSTCGSQGLLPYLFTITFQLNGTFKLSQPVVREYEAQL